MSPTALFYIWFFALLSFLAPKLHGVTAVGICYGTNAHNLPPATKVVETLHSHKVNRVRLYSPAPTILNALRNSSIRVALGVPNQDLRNLARNNDSTSTNNWVRRNISPHSHEITFNYLVVGDEAIPGVNSQRVLTTMKKLYNSLRQAGLHQKLKVTTSVSSAVLARYRLPSAARFSYESSPHMEPILRFLADTGSPLLANVHPYKAYADYHNNITSQFTLFQDSASNVRDGRYIYNNHFDVMLDAFHVAIERVNTSRDVRVVVSETGWPTAGGYGAGIREAQTYNSRLISHLSAKRGTPRQPGVHFETYLFSLFNEDRRPAWDEKYWGIFHNNRTLIYNLTFSGN